MDTITLTKKYEGYLRQRNIEDITIKPYCAYGRYSFFVTVKGVQIHTNMTTRKEAVQELEDIYQIIIAMRA